jgi:hypothetical protein
MLCIAKNEKMEQDGFDPDELRPPLLFTVQPRQRQAGGDLTLEESIKKGIGKMTIL